MSRLFFLLVLFISQTLSAQLSSQRLSLVKAERDFVNFAKTAGLREAFIRYLSPDAVLLEQGKEVNGLQSWSSKPVTNDSGYVFWDPVFVDVSGSGDFGYTTGPLSVFRSKKDTTPAGRGYFTSIWSKNKAGEWKLIFDLGSPASEPASPVLHTSKIILPENKSAEGVKEIQRMFDRDSSYNYLLQNVKKSADPSYFSSEGRLYRNRYSPLLGAGQIATFKDLPGRSFNFAKLGGKIASSGDLAYSYGRVTVTIDEKGILQSFIVGYLRIWKKEDGKNWTLVLDVLG